jgi:hypothetical protein
MHQKRPWLNPALLLATALAVAAWGVTTSAQDESSLLVETPADPVADAPKLSPPANHPTLPPPELPVSEELPVGEQETAARETAAKPAASPAVKRPFMRPAEPQRREAARPVSTGREEIGREEIGREEVIPAPPTPAMEVAVRPAPPIKYDTDGDARRMYRRSGEVNVVMVTKNPADGCFYEIPMCIPACCVGEPSVSGGRGIFGRGVVEYCWPNGFRAEVKFRQILGDVKVEYEGD